MAPVSQIDLLELGGVALIAGGKMLKSKVFDFAKKEIDYLLQFIDIYPSKSLEDIKRFKYAKTYWKEDFGGACKEAKEILDNAWRTGESLKILLAYGKCLKVTTSGIVKFCNRYPYLTNTVLSTVTIALAATLFVFAPFSGLVIPAASIGSLVIPSISLQAAAFAGGVGISLKFIHKAIFGNPKEHDISKTLEENKVATEEDLIKLLNTKHQIQKNLDELYKKASELKKSEGLANSLAQITLNMQNKLEKNNHLTMNPLELLTVGLKEEQIHKLAKLDIDQQKLKEFVDLAKDLQISYKQYMFNLRENQYEIEKSLDSIPEKKFLKKELDNVFNGYITNLKETNNISDQIKCYQKGSSQIKQDLKELRKTSITFLAKDKPEQHKKFTNSIASFINPGVLGHPPDLFVPKVRQLEKNELMKEIGISWVQTVKQQQNKAPRSKEVR